ncbi:MAG: tetratricopeptide repeat protein [Gemmatimonadetes bacterium]|nr:tetratricopeptide repeat protein [Gemmatimonadota bacterium]
MSAKHGLALVLLLAAATACKPEEAPQPEATQVQEESPPAQLPIPLEVAAQLDSGSAAFRADDFAGALAHYTKATELAPDLAAGWFGVFMAQEALGNPQAAQEALAKTQALEPGTSLVHPTAGDTAR